MIKKIVAAALVATGLMATSAQADNVRLGTLTCQVDGVVGLVIGSHTRGECVFTHTNGRTQHYLAEFSRLGLDLGVTGNKTIVWAVLGVGTFNGDLAGVYTGANAEVTAGIGVGVNALVGGMDESFILNPVSVSGQTGLNVAGGIATLRLE